MTKVVFRPSAIHGKLVQSLNKPRHPMPSSPTSAANDEIQLRVLRLLAAAPQMTQREMAEVLSVSLGKTNFCIKALFERGLIKLHNFQNSRHKLAYSYFLTPAGIAEKGAITARFLKLKMAEYEQLRVEIASLQHEVAEIDVAKKLQS